MTTKKLCTLLLLLTHISSRANDTISHTFFTEQPTFHAALPSKISLVYDRMTARGSGVNGTIQIVPFYSASTNGPAVAKFFLPFGKTTLTAGEFDSQAVLDGSVDIMANYFGVLTQPVNQVFMGSPEGLVINGLTFQSLFRFRPTQTTTGVGLTYKQKISNPEQELKGFWLQFSAPMMQVSNDLGFKETIMNYGGGAIPEGFVGSIGDALRGNTVFGNKQFQYGKICDCPLTKWGVGDIEFSVGYENKEGCHIFQSSWYTGLVIPTGNKPKGEFIFEPIVGNNKHWGLMLGGEYCYRLWSNAKDSKNLWVHVTGHSQYLFQNTQRRSFDLLDKQWSRYMWVYEQQFPTVTIFDVTPGINVFTQDVTVSPSSSFNSTSALVFVAGGFIGETGYSTYYRQAEQVELACPFTKELYIVGIDESDTTIFATKSNASMRRYLFAQGINIDLNADGSINPVRITEADLDLRSAAHPCLVAHVLYGTLGYRWDELECPAFIALGGSYEFARENMGLDRWTVWGKGGVSF